MKNLRNLLLLNLDYTKAFLANKYVVEVYTVALLDHFKLERVKEKNFPQSSTFDTPFGLQH